MAERGKLRIPRFQRSFVWSREDVRKLFDSIWRGFPIGTLLWWQSDAPQGTVAFGPAALEVQATSDAYWIVDGQQRVASLVGVLSAEVEGADPIFDLCFDLRRQRFVHAGRPPLPDWWLPLRVALESRRYLEWLRTQDLSSEELATADALGGTLRDYRLLAYVVDNEDEDLLRDVFDRVNRAGKPISRAQAFHALFGGDTDAASPTAVVNALRHEGFGELRENTVVQSLLALRGGDPQRELHEEFGSNEIPADWFDHTERALIRVIRFLRSQGVPHVLLVPTTLPIPLLAAFFHLHPDPDPWNERLLARWLWRGWVHGFGPTGDSGQTPALRQAVKAVHPRKGAEESAPSEYDAVRALLDLVPDQPVPQLVGKPFRTNRADSRLSLLGMISRQPLSFDGEPIDVGEQLERHGTDVVIEIVPGHRDSIAARALGPLLPGLQADNGPQPELTVGLFWNVARAWPQMNDRTDLLRKVQKSHLIEGDTATALQQDDVDGFLTYRSRAVDEAVTGFLRSKVDPGALVRPPLTDLFVSDDEAD